MENRNPEVSHEVQMGVRLNKYISDAGICSRREADRQIERGNVTINGVIAQMGTRVQEQDEVCFCGKKVRKEEELILIAYNKPRGVVCTTQKQEERNIIDVIQYPKRIYPVGRLDKDSEGLILLTNDGEMMNQILRGRNGHEKEYVVTVMQKITPEFLKGMKNGVPILDTVTKNCQVEQVNDHTFRIVLTQGLNRQIRRMCEYFGYRVRTLTRVRVLNIKLGKLKSGTYRNVTETELEELRRQLSQNRK